MEKLFCPLCEREYEQGIKFCPHDASGLIVRSKDAMAGQVFDGRYRILHKLGEGGMGAVYKAVQISTNKPVAIKMVSAHHTENENTIRRFQREVKLQSRLEHPNIVTVLDFAKTPEGQYFFVMPFIEGKSLRQMILDGGKFSISDFLSLAMQMCDGLECAHGEGIVHRDMKGDNVVVAHIGSQRVAKILDFGLAKALGVDDDATKSGIELTSAGRAMGTPAYMSPEQARGEAAKIGPRSDLYSLGVIFYQMLTGILPFRSDTPWGVMHQHVSEPPVPLRQVNPDVPEIIERAVMRLLEKDPEKRYPSALALRRDLASAAANLAGRTEEMRLTPPSGLVNPAKGSPSAKPLGRVAVAAGLLLAVAGGLYLMFGSEAPKSPAPMPIVAQKPAETPATSLPTDVPATEKKAEPQVGATEVSATAPSATEQADKEKREKVESLLMAAEKDLAANRLVTPKGKNALEKYREALSIDPANESAKAGTEKIAARAVELAHGAIGKNQPAKAEEYLAVAEAVQPGYPPAVKAREVLSQRQVADVSPRRERAEQKSGSEHEKKKEAPSGMVFVPCGKFFMDKHEVTQAEYEKVMEKSRPEGRSCPNCPVDMVDWSEANAYCEKAGKRLPTEQEWEMAARSCKDKPEYATASGGLSVDEANYKESGLKKAVKIGSYPPNPLGLHDMSGNVWEWTSSAEGDKRILRGGSWNDKASYLTVSHRFEEKPTTRTNDNGFRCVK
ncbi:MAG: SUMF1/EgtB/PvdO family nonheme iron enzyme [Nitrospinae bacterium]|nr:SUMF1/EgtB/PvdO family nonheme iron enzyme [Nitrospinota bacterium]MBF0633975.1 SUMF1/EgtB/PvdO family nonheme iron enzyme [Nitrospinota bacterium]